MLDRASYHRSDAVWLAAQAAKGLFLPFWQNRPFIAAERAGFLPWRADWTGSTRVFLGLDGGQPLFAVDLPGESEPLLDGGTFQEMRAAAFVLPARDTAIAGHAKALLDWHKRHGFCPNCGNITQMCDGGYRRLCSGCGAELGLIVDSALVGSQCSDCHTPLEAIKEATGTLLNCRKCGGQFAEHALLRSLIEQPEMTGQAFPDAPYQKPLAKATLERVHYRPCAVCGQMMNRKNFGGASGVIVDVCARHGTWFDAGELPQVLEFC